MRRANRGRVQQFQVPRIGQYAADIRLTRIFRFTTQSTGVTLQTISRANLLNMLVMPATTSTSFRLINSIRVLRVRIWGEDPAFAAAATEAYLEWISEDGPNVSASSLSCGVQPAYISVKPPARSLASFWADSGYDEATNVMQVTVPGGSTLELTCELVIPADIAAVAGPGSAAHLTVGAITAVPLDGVSGKLTPVDQLAFLP